MHSGCFTNVLLDTDEVWVPLWWWLLSDMHASNGQGNGSKELLSEERRKATVSTYEHFHLHGRQFVMTFALICIRSNWHPHIEYYSLKLLNKIQLTSTYWILLTETFQFGSDIKKVHIVVLPWKLFLLGKMYFVKKRDLASPATICLLCFITRISRTYCMNLNHSGVIAHHVQYKLPEFEKPAVGYCNLFV